MAGKKIKELTEAASLNGTDNVIVEDSTPKTKRTTLDKVREWLQGTIEVSTRPITFTQATTRANVATGDTLATIAGKLAKLFADLSGHAFKATTKDLTTTVEGSALDATMGKKLKDGIDTLNPKFSYFTVAESDTFAGFKDCSVRLTKIGNIVVGHVTCVTSTRRTVWQSYTVFTGKIPEGFRPRYTTTVSTPAQEGSVGLQFTTAGSLNVTPYYNMGETRTFGGIILYETN